ncbi:hypothetical protein [Bacillus alkalicellulosilyticus]|uniref:hypothetical protein n=1 Tax=Alkalihalobacterium alkalicellulosilyticum TaxID=1912214 RepID=UPI0009985496|nr:hypothetical protein [Bacillus alkalicellulosilyticus]
MKKIYGILVMGLFFLFVAACGGAPSEVELENETEPVKQEVVEEEVDEEIVVPEDDNGVDEVEQESTIDEPEPLTDEEQIIEVIEKNAMAAKIEDIELYMGTIHSRSPLYESTETTMLELFATYILDYSIDEVEVVRISGNVAEVRFVQTTVKIEGPEFNDNVIEGIHVLRLEDGEWKIFETQVLDATFLNEQPAEVTSTLPTDDATVADYFQLIIPFMDEDFGNYPGQPLPDDTYQFISNHLHLFPATESTLEENVDLINFDVDYRHISKSLSNYTSSLFYSDGYVIEIYEEYVAEIDSYFTEVLVYTDYGVFDVIYPGVLDDIFAEDYVEFIGVPTIHSGFPNVGGGYTNVIVVIASFVE